MTRPLMAGVACGLLWWGVSLAVGAKAYGVLGSSPWTGAIAGACTGVILAAVSTAFYRRSSVRDLLWYSPLSVYVSIAVYGFLAFLIRLLLGDFHADQIRWAVGMQSVLGMWWGVTFVLHVALLVHLLAYANHRLLRRIAAGS